MQEQEFKKLLDKYFEGALTKNEERILHEFNEELKSKNRTSDFENESEKIQFQESIWSGIDMQTAKKPRTQTWKSVAAVAAMFIGVIALGYLYLKNTSANPMDLIPENAITLEMEDGSVKVIEEDGTINIIDKNGNILGQQQGNQLVYSKESVVEELAFNTLKVPYGKTFELELSDGTKAYLNAGSSIKYPTKFLKGLKRQIFITGEAYLDVAKDSLHPFIASSGGINVQVLGTQFNFSAYPEDDLTEVVLVEGAVSLFTEADGYDLKKNTILKPGLKGSFNKENYEVSTQEVITSIYTSWMNGKLVFRNMAFKNILKKLERHYDVTIENNNVGLSDKIFNANFGQETLANVLEELNTNYGVNYTISENKITIQ